MSERLTDRPTKPGVWFRDGEVWIVRCPRISGEVLFATMVDQIGYLAGGTKVVEDLPPGNWSPAVPASRVAELQSKLDAAHDPKSVGNIAWLAEQYKLRAEKAEAERDAVTLILATRTEELAAARQSQEETP